MSSDAPAVQIDPDELKQYSLNVWGYKQGEVVSLMIHIGDRLGLYQALDGAGPVTAAELAERTGLQERWLLEWLRNQAAAKILDFESAVAPHEGDRFELTPVGSAVLADEENS
ncbi:MAG: SAM-dependent methyltransferase, partial [Candidatus Hydrogenedentes bacterium]|nr:SAM-dependent methyltransferase [Candidatus Hydrogenedentota bacterium]